MSLGENICRLRAQRGWSQEELADALGVSRQSISKWETDSSVPELDKLVKLSGLFGVTLDELVLGARAPAEAEPPPTEERKTAPAPAGSPSRLAGVILLCFGALVWLLFTLLGDVLVGLFFASPFLLCGAICCLCRRDAGLWCAWALFSTVHLYLRWATGITWRLVLLTLRYEPSMNYMRLAFAWVELACFLLFFAVTLRRFGKRPLPAAGRTPGLLLAGWALFALLHVPLSLDPLSGLGYFVYIFSDWFKFVLLTLLSTCTLRYVRSRKGTPGG